MTKCNYRSCLSCINPVRKLLSSLFRYTKGWMLPLKFSLVKLTQTKGIKRLCENNHGKTLELLTGSFDYTNRFESYACIFLRRNFRGLII